MENILLINGKKCKTKEELFNTFSEILNFEDYFSNNWDSFEEILNDLYLNFENQKIFILNYASLLEKDKEDLEIFENIIQESNKNNDYQFYKVMEF